MFEYGIMGDYRQYQSNIQMKTAKNDKYLLFTDVNQDIFFVDVDYFVNIMQICRLGPQKVVESTVFKNPGTPLVPFIGY